MEAFSTLLSLCAGNSPATVNSPHRGQWRGTLMFFFDLRRNKRLSKQPWGWWFKTPSWSLWRQCNEQNVLLTLTSMCLYIYIYAYRSICFIYIYLYACVYVLFLFYLIDFIIYVRDEHEALHCILANSIVPKCCTVTCFLAPSFDNYLLWNRD